MAKFPHMGVNKTRFYRRGPDLLLGANVENVERPRRDHLSDD